MTKTGPVADRQLSGTELRKADVGTDRHHGQLALTERSFSVPNEFVESGHLFIAGLTRWTDVVWDNGACRLSGEHPRKADAPFAAARVQVRGFPWDIRD